MAIFIKGRTTCRICRQVLTSSAVMVGFPNMALASGLEEIADSCVHRSCLDAHPRHEELARAWAQHWLAQAERAGAQSSIQPQGVIIFNKKRFTFATLESFVVIEDPWDAFDRLRAFFGSFDGREPLSVATPWNTYELAPSASATHLLVTANHRSGTTLRATPESTVIDHVFTPARWIGFRLAWKALETTPACSS